MRWTPEVVVTLLVRFGGLALAIVSISFATRLVTDGLFSLERFMGSNVFGAVDMAVPGLFSLLLCAGGLYCFLSGRWVIGRLLRGLRDSHRCPHCGYDLTGIKPGSTRCPECGKGVG